MEETLDISALLKTLKKHFAAVVTIALVVGIASFLVSNFLITKKYESSAMLYVENSQNTSESVNINDINAAQKLVNTCQILFKSGTALDTLIENLELPYTKKELSEMITAASVNGTEVMKLVVESEDPVEAQIIVNELVDISQSEFKRIIKSGSIEIVELGEISTIPSSPNVKLITLIGFALGLVMAYAIFFIRDMLDVLPGEYVSVKVSDEPLANYGANTLTLESDDFEAAGIDPTANIEIICNEGQIIIQEAEDDE